MRSCRVNASTSSNVRNGRTCYKGIAACWRYGQAHMDRLSKSRKQWAEGHLIHFLEIEFMLGYHSCFSQLRLFKDETPSSYIVIDSYHSSVRICASHNFVERIYISASGSLVVL